MILAARLLVAVVHHRVHHLRVLVELELEHLLPPPLLLERRLQQCHLRNPSGAVPQSVGHFLTARGRFCAHRLHLAVPRCQSFFCLAQRHLQLLHLRLQLNHLIGVAADGCDFRDCLNLALSALVHFGAHAGGRFCALEPESRKDKGRLSYSRGPKWAFLRKSQLNRHTC